MTLIEVLVSLAILSIVTGLALSMIGPWLGRERRLEAEGRFWRDAETAQLLLGELTAGAVDLQDNLQRGPDAVNFTAYAPRLSPELTHVSIAIEQRGPRANALVVRTPDLPGGGAVLLDDGAPLRMADAGAPPTTPGVQSPIVIEAKVGSIWTPAVISAFPSNAPSHCVFDLISQVCR